MLRLAVLTGAVLLLAAPPARAQDETAMEAFEAVDPYTLGEKDAMARLGYATFGPFPWMQGDSTAAAQEQMGGIPMLWVETEHFKIGSSLNTYTLPGDREEKARLAQELERLGARLGKLKAPKRELDPWLRLHLFAQRAEELYAAFQRDFGLAPADYADVGPYLGQPRKFLLLLCERQSEYGRFLTTYAGGIHDLSHRFGSKQTGFGFAINAEGLRGLWTETDGVPFDAVLASHVASGLANQLVDAYRGSDYRSPAWLVAAYGHVCSRRVDPRYPSGCGYAEGQSVREEDHEWEPRVANLVRNDFFASTEAMFGWLDSTPLTQRDHLVAWSKLQYLLTEAQGDRKGFLADVCPPDPKLWTDDPAALVKRQTAALAQRFHVTPQELDEAWSRWAAKAYARR